MFLARIVFFRLHESPRFLVHAGRPQDALESLQMISRFNGSELELALEDVVDRISHPSNPPQPSIQTENSSTPLFDADGEIADSPKELTAPHAPTNASMPLSPSQPEGVENTPLIKDYSAMGESDAPLAAHTSERHTFSYQTSPESPRTILPSLSRPSAEEEEGLVDGTQVPPAHPRPPRTLPGRADTRTSVRSSFYEVADRAWWALPRSIRRPLRAWFDRFTMVLAPEWRRTTILVWGAWWGMSLAYTMFNVYLPKLLETRQGDMRTSAPRQTPSQAHVQGMDALERTLWEVVIFTIGGCPGAVVRYLCRACRSLTFKPHLVGRVVNRMASAGQEAGSCGEHVFDGSTLWGFCSCAQSACGHGEHRRDQPERNGSYFCLSLAWGRLS